MSFLKSDFFKKADHTVFLLCEKFEKYHMNYLGRCLVIYNYYPIIVNVIIRMIFVTVLEIRESQGK